MKKYFVFLLLLCFTACKLDFSSKQLDLLSDPSLNNLKKRGGNAEYKLENGILTGYARMGTPNTFLCTKQKYKNFILNFDVSIDARLNSGVQIRSDSMQVNARETIGGYQVEIDPSDRAWSGGIYEENGRGWIHSLAHNAEARKAFKNNAWNSFHIEAIDENIRVWINGINTANLLDSVTTAGYIGFQVHSIDQEGLAGAEVQWKNIELITGNFEEHLVPLKETDPEINLLANTLSEKEIADGWISLNEINTGKLKKQILFPNVKGDFEFKIEYRVNKRETAIIEYGQGKKKQPSLQFSILDEVNVPKVKMDSYKSGGLYGLQAPSNLSNPERDKPLRMYNQWSQVHIRYEAGRVQHWLNNSLVLDYNIEDVAEVNNLKQIIFRSLGGGAYVRSAKLRNI